MDQRILFVTSQAEAMSSIVAVVEAVMQQLTTLVGPAEVMAIAERQPVDLVIFDIQSDKSLLSILRDFKVAHPLVPVLALVGYGDVDMVEYAMEYGADDYIAQPIPLERLKTTLRNMLRLRSLLTKRDFETVTSFGYSSSRSLSHLALSDKKGNLKKLCEIEDMVIEHAIQASHGCITQAAKALGVGRSTLYRKMQSKTRLPAQISRENQTTRPMMAVSATVDS